MRILKTLFVLLAIAVPVSALGAINADDLPATSTWYFHVDFEEMRDSEAGRTVFDWLDDEVFEEIRDEVGIDLGSDADSLTAFSADGNGMVLVMDGRFSQDTRDKVMAAAAGAESLDLLKSGSRTFYFIQGDRHDDDHDDHDAHGDDSDDDSGNIEIDGFDDGAYFSFAVDDKFLLTSGREQMEALLDNRGRISGQRSTEGALFVLTAERSLIQAGMNTDEFEEGDSDFESNILRNTKHVALMIADVAGKLAIEAQLVAEEAEMAQSIASIVRGLIALQAFDDDMDPEVSEFLRSTRVDVDDNTLKISVAVSPEAVTAALDDA